MPKMQVRKVYHKDRHAENQVEVIDGVLCETQLFADSRTDLSGSYLMP